MHVDLVRATELEDRRVLLLALLSAEDPDGHDVAELVEARKEAAGFCIFNDP